MLNLYKKIEKSSENNQGSIYLSSCPFDRPCFLAVSAQDIEKSVFGITKAAMKMARLRTRNDKAAMYDVKGFPVDFLAIRNEINVNMDADQFVEKYLSDILKRNREEVKRCLRNINLFAYCNGTIRVKKILKSIEKALINNGFDNVDELMKQICVITFLTDVDLTGIKATVVNIHDINDPEVGKNPANISEELE